MAFQTSRTFIVVELENVRASAGEGLPSGRLRPLQTATGYGSESVYIVGSRFFIDPDIRGGILKKFPHTHKEGDTEFGTYNGLSGFRHSAIGDSPSGSQVMLLASGRM
jgi:hypothetical protein